VPEAWVYILRCRDGSLYTGWTVDVPRRVAQHSAGKASRYTRARLPIELAASFPMATAQAARQREARIKRMRRAQKLTLLKSASDDP
jgi:putative endonuclease